MWQMKETQSVIDDVHKMIGQSHKIRIRLTCMDADNKILWNDEFPEGTLLEDSSVEFDGTSDGNSRMLHLSVLNHQGKWSCDPLHPTNSPLWVNQLIRASYGIYSPVKAIDRPDTDGYVYIPVMTAVIKTIEMRDDATVVIEGEDKASNFKDPGKFMRPYTIKKGSKLSTVIHELAEAYGETMFRIQSNNYRLKGSHQFAADDDIWEKLKYFAAATSWALFYDGEGYLVFRPRNNNSICTFTTGATGNIVVPPTRLVEFDEFKNVVMVTGKDAKVLATVSLPSNHPLSWQNVKQVRPHFYENTSISTVKQAKEKANQLLTQLALVTNNVTFSALPNPLLEETDYIQVIDSNLSVNLKILLETFVLPLTHKDPMEIGSEMRLAVKV